MLARHYRSDARLIRRILRGDRELFAVLVKRYTRSTYALAYAHLGNTHDAEETSQEAFLRAYRDLNRLDDPARFGPWLLSMVRHISIDRIRKRIREREFVEGATKHLPAAAPDPGRQELYALLRDRIDHLKIEHREVLTLHYFAGKSSREIAELLGESREAVKKRLQRAREELSRSLLADLDEVLRIPQSDVDRIERRTSRAIALVPVTWDSPQSIPSPSFSKPWPAHFFAPANIAGGVAVVVVGLALALPDGSTDDARVPEETVAATLAPGERGAPTAEPTASPAVPHGPQSHAPQRRPSRGNAGLLGHVTPPTGQSIRVVAERVDWEKHEPPPRDPVLSETTTDENGAYVFRGLESGNYVLLAMTKHRMAVGGATVADGEAAVVNLNLLDAEPVSARVLYADGTPAAHAWVYPREHLQSKSLWSGFSTALRALTDSNGAFRFPALWRGEWRVTIKAPNAPTLETDPMVTGTEDTVVTLPQGGLIEGQVLHANSGLPLEGIHVVVPGLYRRDRFEAVTDANGYYRVARVHDGAYQLVVFDPNYIAQNDPQTAVVTPEATTTVPAFHVVESAHVHGRVIDADSGDGVPGVVVTVDGLPGVPVTADSSGRFTMGGMRDGVYDVRIVQAPGYALAPDVTSRKVSVRVGSVPASVEFSLVRGCTVHGIVSDGSSEPVPGARVSLTQLNGQVLDTLGTGFDGRFVADGMPPDTFVLVSASCDTGRSPHHGPLQTGNPEDWPCALTIGPAAGFAGSIVNLWNEPLPHWRVLAMREGDTAAVWSDSSPDGAFHVDGLLPGAYTVFGVPPGGEAPLPDAQPVRAMVAASGTSPPVRLVCDAGLTITGRVEGDVRAVENGLVEAFGPVNRIARTDDHGYYTLAGLTEGAYRIHVSFATCCSAEQDNVPAGATSVDFLLVSRGSISGRVIDAATRKPISAYEIGFGVGRHEHITTEITPWLANANDPEGRFVLNFVDAGEVTILARAPGYVDAVLAIPELPAGETLRDVEIAMTRGGRFSGRVVNEHGKAISRASVYLHNMPPFRSGTHGALTHTDSEGRFSVSNLPHDGAILWVAHPLYAAIPINVEPRQLGTQGTRIVLHQGGTLEGRIHCDDPLPNVSVALTGASGVIDMLPIENDGTFRSPPLPAGEYEIQARIHDGAGQVTRSVSRVETIAMGAANAIDWWIPPADAQLQGSMAVAGNVTATLRVDRGDEFESIAVKRLPDGSYESAPAPAGPAMLNIKQRLEDGSTKLHAIPCTLRPGECLTLDLDLN